MTTHIPPAALVELIDYDAATGALLWRKRELKWFKPSAVTAEHGMARWNRNFAGKPAISNLTNEGYFGGELLGRSVLAHRVAWAIIHGAWPCDEIDHINGNRTDNRIENLRLASRTINVRNRQRRSDNTSGTDGVCWHAAAGKWRVRLGRKHIGIYADLQDAISARKEAEAIAGYHVNHGRTAPVSD